MWHKDYCDLAVFLAKTYWWKLSNDQQRCWQIANRCKIEWFQLSRVQNETTVCSRCVWSKQRTLTKERYHISSYWSTAGKVPSGEVHAMNLASRLITATPVVTKLRASRSQQNRATLQREQPSPGGWRQLRTSSAAKLAKAVLGTYSRAVMGEGGWAEVLPWPWIFQSYYGYPCWIPIRLKRRHVIVNCAHSRVTCPSFPSLIVLLHTHLGTEHKYSSLHRMIQITVWLLIMLIRRES
jgi:hypothetical protein